MSKKQVWNYDAISEFNNKYYKDLLFESHIVGAEVHFDKVNEDVFFYPLKKDRVTYLLPSGTNNKDVPVPNYVNMLPVQVKSYQKVSFQNKVYHVVTDADPKGLGKRFSFDSYRDFVDQFCNYEHSNPTQFTLWKIVAITAYISRLNVRVATQPAFGKDSVIKVMGDLLGNVAVVHNPTVAKIEYLLLNPLIMTNEVAGIKSEEVHNLSNYYLTCGDFSNSYEKRSIANIKGAKDRYDISTLSNVVAYNDIDCYPEKQHKKYFDSLFQKAIHQRFLPLRFKGKITEQFNPIIDVPTFVSENIDSYKNTIKTFKWLIENVDELVHGYTVKEYDFKDRALRNWLTICSRGIDPYCESQEEFDTMCDELYQCHKYYEKMFEDDNVQQALLDMDEVM